eukprot:1207054-Alexandrium_andersonii.AAC.1
MCIRDSAHAHVRALAHEHKRTRAHDARRTTHVHTCACAHARALKTSTVKNNEHNAQAENQGRRYNDKTT